MYVKKEPNASPMFKRNAGQQEGSTGEDACQGD